MIVANIVEHDSQKASTTTDSTMNTSDHLQAQALIAQLQVAHAYNLYVTFILAAT